MRRAVVLLAACGRVGFDEAPADTEPAIDAPLSIAARMPCNAHVLLDSGGHNPHDVVRWVQLGEDEWLVGADHYAQDDHKIERHRLAAVADGAVAGPAEFMVQANHVDILGFEPAGVGMVMGFTDFNLRNGIAVQIGPGLEVANTVDLGELATGNPPLTRIGGGKLAMIGVRAGALEIIEIGGDGAATGRTLQIVTAADGPDTPTMAELPDGLVVAWRSTATDDCKLAVVDANLAMIAGPTALGVPSCHDPHLAFLFGPQRLVVVADDQATTAIAAAIYDPSLAQLAAPRTIAPSAHWARTVADGIGGAWVAYAILPAPQKVGHVLLDDSANVVSTGAGVGELDETLGHFHQIDRVGNAAVVVWTDVIASRTFSARRLCP